MDVVIRAEKASVGVKTRDLRAYVQAHRTETAFLFDLGITSALVTQHTIITNPIRGPGSTLPSVVRSSLIERW